MFNTGKIQSSLYGVVGFRQPYNPDYAILDADNTSSEFGEWVTNNPFCKIEYLYDNQDYRGLTDVQFNERLKQMQEDSIANVCHRVFNKADYIDRQVLFKNAQNRVNVEELEDGFVCFKIRVASTKNVAFKITRVFLDFQGSGDIKLMLFNTSQDTPINEQTITVTGTHQVESLDWVVDNSADTYKGEYYLGYRTNDPIVATLKPFKRDYESSDVMSYISEMSFEKYQFVGHATDTLPDLNDESNMDEAIGINPDITVYDDFTDMIIQNKFLFARAINLDLQIKCMEMYISSLRSNINERNSQLIITELIQRIEGVNKTDGSIKISGLKPELSRAINAIRGEIEKLKDSYHGDYAKIDTLT